MKEPWKIQFIFLWSFLVGFTLLIMALLGMTIPWVIFSGFIFYLITGIEMYVLVADVWPLRQSWKLILCWLPFLFSEKVFSWAMRKF